MLTHKGVRFPLLPQHMKKKRTALSVGELVMRADGSIGMVTKTETHLIHIEYMTGNYVKSVTYLGTAQMLRNNYLAYRRRMEYNGNDATPNR